MRKTDGDTEDELDLRGLRCPLPALRTERQLRRMAPGERLAVLADDPLARLDIPHLCNAGGHALLATEAGEGFTRFRIRKGSAALSATAS